MTVMVPSLFTTVLFTVEVVLVVTPPVPGIGQVVEVELMSVVVKLVPAAVVPSVTVVLTEAVLLSVVTGSMVTTYDLTYLI